MAVRRCLLGALLLAAPFGASALTARSPPSRDDEGEDDPWVSGCEARLAGAQVDDLDYGPCFDEDAAEAALSATQPLAQQRATKPVPKTMFVEAGGSVSVCDGFPSPTSDRDVLGHGNPVCRYEPSVEELEQFRLHPEDVAIVIPSNKVGQRTIPDEPSMTQPLERGVLTWKQYAKYHGYAIYSGMPENASVDCPGLEKRHGAWTKPCMAMQLIKKHRYLIVVDRDTTVLKPRLRLEPLFRLAGLMDSDHGKVVAVAHEWGSCMKGFRLPQSGDVNTGVMLIKQSKAAQTILESWFYGPTRCHEQPRTTEQPEIPQGWPFESPPCQGCDCLQHVRKHWSYDQLGFFSAVVTNETLKGLVTVFRSGCPINSPFADFIPHLVSGTPSHQVYSVYGRIPASGNLQACAARLMEAAPGTGDPYERCSLCDAVPEGARGGGSWSYSCPGGERRERGH